MQKYLSFPNLKKTDKKQINRKIGTKQTPPLQIKKNHKQKVSKQDP